MTTQRQRSYSTSASPRRSFSLPLRPPESLRATSEYSTISASCVDAGTHIQVLFAHPDSKIVNFTFSATTTLRGDPLPWSSPAERTIASGPLRIYKTVPHDVAFLQSGSALKPLLSRTQCWNVDGGQIFCLQLRPGNYWRIEIL
ncbi:inheritance of peroxisomes protein 1-domain-containing protein, partial [Sphaerosporella brunnea]